MINEIFTLDSIYLYTAWFTYLAVLYHFLPGKRMPGVEIEPGFRLTYPINGHLSFWITIVLSIALVWFGVIPVQSLIDLLLFFFFSSLPEPTYNSYAGHPPL